MIPSQPLARMTKLRQLLPSRSVVILAFDGAQILDIAGPLQAFTSANEEAGVRYLVDVCSLAGGPVMTASGLPLLTKRLPHSSRIDTLIVPGGPGVHPARQSPKVVDSLRRVAGRARRQCAVCTGAFLMAEAGLLDGRPVVTHWRSCARLAREYPALHVDEDAIYIRDGNVWTTAGVTAGIDLALALIEEDHGPGVALRVARRLVVYLRRPGGQRQFSEPLALQSGAEGAYTELLEAIAAKPAQNWQVEDMAAAARQSLRTFFRRFQSATGSTPADAVERIRCEQAKTLLQTTDLPIASVARRVGFRTESSLRRAMKRLFGMAPTELRRAGA
jgi:transcriptional regulator GlxA family with amidase domain